MDDGGIDWVPGPGPDDKDRVIKTDLFTVEVMSAWGDTWIWNDIPVDDVMEVYEALGDPSAFYRLGQQPEEET
jgi:hypothetical protein